MSGNRALNCGMEESLFLTYFPSACYNSHVTVIEKELMRFGNGLTNDRKGEKIKILNFSV